MNYSVRDVMEYVKEEDVKFIRLAFCDVDGKLKNASVMPTELERAFSEGVAFDGSAVKGFGKVEQSDLFLFPDPDTLTLLPWRPMSGKVIRLLCDVKTPDGKPFVADSRNVLKEAVAYAKERGIVCDFGTEFEFYLFKVDENGEMTDIPCDEAGYMDVAPADRGENVRREICLTIEEMGLCPECSHHEEGPGQNEIDFKYSDALTSADNAVVFKNATESIAYKNGFFASFAPKPVKDRSGSGLHINVSLRGDNSPFESFLAGLLDKIGELTAFFNPTEESYERLGKMKAPDRICWSTANRSALVRIPATNGKNRRFELRSPDGCANVYLAYALILYAGVEGVEKGLSLPAEGKGNMYGSTDAERLPTSLAEARKAAKKSEFVAKHIPQELISAILNG